MTLEQESYKRIIENLHDGLYFVDKNRVITYWNKAAEEISGFSADEVVGKSCADNILTHVDSEGNSICKGRCPLAATIADGQPRETEVYMHHKAGHRIPVSVRVNTLTDNDGNIIGGVELFTDISSQAASALRVKELEKMALLDNLTQLPNRNYIESELEKRFEEKKRFDVPFGLLFMDIDHFKVFNDTHGHDVGDEVLKFVAETFTANARPFDLFGRWGGEEFLGIIRNVDGENLGMIGDRIRQLVGNSYIMHQDKKLHVTISIGATLVEENDTIDKIIKRADTLLYKSKESGRNCLTMG
ncbi:PAS domain S-box-containing protein/diguanylate cyclase (GGDEF) domain-containing protein [Desulfocicer vacuolatum DSM 3385]|uniref:PAS domain S-box-containing protein/diguanylate cyclase (GGDEF) domain-containing protein n=1 Tax=Desulfocicer vacuolatum DSM 3385 TaxID=1121400 RepID=A0A1W2ED01_9BACT|nr:diguanylate cyclase [Desulfocicer vacuolatum]SMD07591.1 PAS domain S-box-containing protein/diguanylate cyclase (GGDEF) domain-containing protein [Desulfocicer vacuolatum DSM 3385]